MGTEKQLIRKLNKSGQKKQKKTGIYRLLEYLWIKSWKIRTRQRKNIDNHAQNTKTQQKLEKISVIMNHITRQGRHKTKKLTSDQIYNKLSLQQEKKYQSKSGKNDK